MKTLALIFALTIPFTTSADTTGRGKIDSVMGHSTPNCRIVRHINNATGVVSRFRIKDVATDDDISAVALTALATGRDTEITFDPAVTSGCGSDPKIGFIVVYRTNT